MFYGSDQCPPVSRNPNSKAVRCEDFKQDVGFRHSDILSCRRGIVASQSSSIGERLANVLFLEVREFSDDLRWRHPVCDEVDDMRDRAPQVADRGLPTTRIRRINCADIAKKWARFCHCMRL